MEGAHSRALTSCVDLALRTSNGTDYCASLTTGQSSTGATGGTTYSTDHGGNLQCIVE